MCEAATESSFLDTDGSATSNISDLQAAFKQCSWSSCQNCGAAEHLLLSSSLVAAAVACRTKPSWVGA